MSRETAAEKQKRYRERLKAAAGNAGNGGNAVAETPTVTVVTPAPPEGLGAIVAAVESLHERRLIGMMARRELMDVIAAIRANAR